MKVLSLLVLCALTLGAAPAYSPLPAAPKDPRIEAMVNAVSAADLRTYDMTLVNFGTRNDFSEDLHTPSRGVFAARDWIRAQFEQSAAKSGGRMTVALDTFVHAKTDRTPRPVTESSIIATLRGDAGGPTYVMSSHYDDCDGKCTDGRGTAPGADDNGSGTSAVLEAAKVMAGQRFRGTIVFAVFDGEELGLWGSQHFADELKARGVDVAANLNNDIIGSSADGQYGDSVRVFSEALPVGTKLDR